MKKFLIAFCLMFSSFGYGFSSFEYGPLKIKYQLNSGSKDLFFQLGNNTTSELGHVGVGLGIGNNYKGAEINLGAFGIGCGIHLSTPVIAALLTTLAGYKLYTHYQSKNTGVAKDTDKNKQPTSPKVAKKTK